MVHNYCIAVMFMNFLLLVLFSSFVLFPTLSLAQGDQNKNQRYENLKIFSDMLHIIEKYYVQEIPVEKLVQGAINGMIKTLDLHSHFLPEEQLKKFTKEATGQFSGIGIEVAIQKHKVVVISVLEDSPAHKASVKSGHIILQINDKKTIGLNKVEISKLLSGRRGKKFNILIKEPDSKDIRYVKLQSKIISFRSVVHKNLGDQFAYIRINTFTERTLREIRKIINKYKKPTGLILDLRGNPGGLFESAIKVADLFIKKGTIVSIKGRLKHYEKVFKAHSSNTLPHFPMVVLIDTYSASAAEILAGALKENKRAMLLGRKSFGKGSVQSLIQMDKGNAIKLTVAHYYTPKGNSIHEQGIHPHVELKEPVPSDKSKSIQFTSVEDTDFRQASSFLKMFRYFNPVSNLSFGP